MGVQLPVPLSLVHDLEVCEVLPSWARWSGSSNVNVMNFVFLDQLVVLLSDVIVISLILASSESVHPPFGFSVEVGNRFLNSRSDDAFEMLGFGDKGSVSVNSSWFSIFHQFVEPLTFGEGKSSSADASVVSGNPGPIVWFSALILFFGIVSIFPSISECFVVSTDGSVFFKSSGSVNVVQPDLTLVVILVLSQTLDDVSVPMSARMSRSEFTGQLELIFEVGPETQPIFTVWLSTSVVPFCNKSFISSQFV
jgi:hypothetical protein